MTYNDKSMRYYSERQERAVASKFDGYVSSNSGAADFSAGDVVLEHYLVECKTCIKNQKSFTIQKEWLDKIRKESFSVGKFNGIVAFNFGPEEKNFFIINEEIMQFLVDKTKQEFNEK